MSETQQSHEIRVSAEVAAVIDKAVALRAHVIAGRFTKIVDVVTPLVAKGFRPSVAISRAKEAGLTADQYFMAAENAVQLLEPAAPMPCHSERREEGDLVTFRIDEAEARELFLALETFYRLGLGQYTHAVDRFFDARDGFDRREWVTSLIETGGALLINLDVGGSWSLWNPEVDDDVRVAYDVASVVDGIYSLKRASRPSQPRNLSRIPYPAAVLVTPRQDMPSQARSVA